MTSITPNSSSSPETGKRSSGFTLTELMITIAVAAIILGAAVPAFTSTINSARLTGTTNDLLGELGYARSEAVRRGQRITLCSSTDGATCSNGAWTTGWVVLDAAGNVLRSHPAPTGNVTILGNASVTGIANRIAFLPSSNTTLVANNPAGVIRVCAPIDAVANNARDITIAPIGGAARTTPRDLGGTCPAP